MGQLKNLGRAFAGGGFSSLVFLFSAFTFFCAALYTLGPQFDRDIYAIYALFVLFATSLISTASFRGSRTEIQKPSLYEILLYLCVFLFGLALGLYRISFFSVWIDEEAQLQATTGWVSIASQAASSQQMPLSYYFTALNIDLLGFNELGLRLFSCLFYAGSGALFYRLAKLLCKNPFLYLPAPYIYLLSPWMIRYAQEGRPYACLLFCGLLWLNAVHDLFMSPPREPSLRKNSLILLSVTLLFFLSISFQPVIFAASLLPALGVLWFFSGWRKKVAALYGVTAVALLTVLPLVLLAKAASSRFLQHAVGWDSLWRSLKNVLTTPHYATSLFLEQTYLLVLVFILAPLLLLLKTRKRQGALWIGISGCLVFSVFFSFLFSLLINYRIDPRYYMMVYPLGLLVIFVCFDHMAAIFKERGVGRFVMPGILTTVLLLFGMGHLSDVYFSKKFDRWNADYKAIYRYIKEEGVPGDVAYVIPFQDPGEWEQRGFLTTQFYYRENSPAALANSWKINEGDTATNLILNDLPLKKPKSVFLAFMGWQPEDPFKKYCSSRPDLALFSGYFFSVCKVSVKDSLPQALEGFFVGLIQAVESKEKAYRMFDILLRLAEYEKNPSKCWSYLAEMKKLKSKHPTIQKIVQEHEGRCKALPPSWGK